MIKYGLLTAEDTNASEFEVYDFLYGLVRLLKPIRCFESGCYKGGGSAAIGRALLSNGIGVLSTCDTDLGMCNHTTSKTANLPVLAWHGSGERFAPDGPYDFAFIDSSGDRVAEVAALRLAPGAVVVLHDSNREQYKPIWTLKPWKSIWHIPTEQGITVFQL